MNLKEIEMKAIFLTSLTDSDDFTWKTDDVHTKLCCTCVFSVLNRERAEYEINE